MPQELVPVYHFHQPVWTSPCQLGDPCPTCRRHQPCITGAFCRDCRIGIEFECERQTPAKPAFWVSFPEALRMLNYGEASFVHRKTAIQLTFSCLTHLRDLSSHVDHYVILQYARGKRRIRIVVDVAWQGAPDISAVAPSQQPSPVLGFAR